MDDITYFFFKFRNPERQNDIDRESAFFQLKGKALVMGDTISETSESGILLISHEDLIKAIPSCTHLACDATFKGIF